MSDLIDRQAAINCLDDELTITGKTNAIIVKDYVRRVANKINELPSVQPEIIRCKDCKWYDEAEDWSPQGICTKYSGIYSKAFYCAGAELRGDSE